MCDGSDKKQLAKDLLIFQQGQDSLFSDSDDVETGLEKIRSKMSDLSNIKNLHFLLGAGASADAIPAMAPLIQIVEDKVNSTETEADIESELCDFTHDDLKEAFQEVKEHSPKNLEHMLGTLYSKRSYLEGVGKSDQVNSYLIELIEAQIYTSINIDCSGSDAEKSLGLYKQLYQKLSLRNKDLARVNVFTTNNDLLSETALGYLNVNYNNGFSSGLSRTFNPARFSYTFSRRIDSGMEKYEPLENMVYLYKLHGSISWIESDDNSFFNIKEIDVEPTTEPPGKNVLIYPTPLKQNKSLGSPYADLIREFQNKLLLQHGVLIVIGYSFSDEHINNAIYAALASNPSLSVVIFGDYSPSENLTQLPDRRIYQISGAIDVEGEKVKIHYFEYIVNKLIPDLDKSRDSDLLEDFIRTLKQARGDS
ncbi:SIR2 family protein [Neptuniibacter sp.]|uniref:SIR2 family protein n=1 Tax=Neptuniibacter sp. TaxID=1962643 RepID=UPI003B5B424B